MARASLYIVLLGRNYLITSWKKLLFTSLFYLNYYWSALWGVSSLPSLLDIATQQFMLQGCSPSLNSVEEGNKKGGIFFRSPDKTLLKRSQELLNNGIQSLQNHNEKSHLKNV